MKLLVKLFVETVDVKSKFAQQLSNSYAENAKCYKDALIVDMRRKMWQILPKNAGKLHTDLCRRWWWRWRWR